MRCSGVRRILCFRLVRYFTEHQEIRFPDIEGMLANLRTQRIPETVVYMFDRIDPEGVEALVHPKPVDVRHLGLDVSDLGSEIVEADITALLQLSGVRKILHITVGVEQVAD